MSEEGSRRAVAEIRFGEDRSSVAKVAGRSIYQFWNVLSPYFRDVLLAPQRRSDDGGVSWTWREPPEARAPTVAEFGVVRRWLEKSAQEFADRPAGAMTGSVSPGGLNSPEVFEQISVRVESMIRGLVTRSDADLAGFVCRTDTGVRVHSWGLAAPAPVQYPDTLESGIAGVVYAGEKPSAGHEVVIENAQGLVMLRTKTDEKGAFQFPKIKPGRFRVRVLSDRVNFPLKGEMVTVEPGEVTRLELRSTSAPGEDTQSETAGDAAGAEKKAVPPGTHAAFAPSSGGRKKTTVYAVLGVLLAIALLAGGGAWMWKAAQAGPGAAAGRASSGIARAPESQAATEDARRAASRPASRTGVEGGLGAAATGAVRDRATPSAARSGTVSARAPAGGGRATAQSEAEVTIETALPADHTADGSVSTGYEKRPPPSTATAAATVDAPDGAGVDADPSVHAPKPAAGALSALPESSANEHLSPPVPEPDAPAKTAATPTKPKRAARSHETLGPDKPGDDRDTPAPPAAGNAPAKSEENPEAPPPYGDVPNPTKPAKTARPSSASSSDAPTPTETPDLTAPVVKVTASLMPPRAHGPAKPSGEPGEKRPGEGTPKSAAPGDDMSPQPTLTTVSGSARSAATRTLTQNSQNAPHASDTASPADDEPVSSAEPGAPLRRSYALRLRPWTPRMLRDAIVPTQPVPVGENDDLESLRMKLMAEKLARMPATFRTPVLRHGVVVEVVSADGTPERLHWSGAVPPDAPVSAGRAELSWIPGDRPAAESVARLLCADGREAARLVVHADGTRTLELVGDARGKFWIGIDFAATDRPAESGPSSPPRFDWQVLKGGGSLVWRADGGGVGGRGSRREISLEAPLPENATFAWVDRATGWALVSGFAERP